MMPSAADRLMLSDLVHRYAGYIDERQFDSAAKLFRATADLILPDPPGRLDPVIRHHGPDAVRTALDALRATIRTQHAIVGEIYTAGEQKGRALGSIAGVAHHWTSRKGQLVDVVWYLRYVDEYQRTTNGWLLARRSVFIDAIESRQVRYVRSDDAHEQ